MPTQFKVKNKFVDLKNNFRKYYIIAVGLFLSALTYLVYQNIITTTTLAVATIVIYVVTVLPTSEIDLEVNEEYFELNESKFNWVDCLGFVIVDLGDTLEFTVQTNKITQDYVYFYIPDNSQIAQDLTTLFTQYLPYNENISKGNITHNILRYFGLK